MPLRDVPPLDKEQWDEVQRVLYSEEPKYRKMRKKMQKTVRDAVKMASKLKEG